MADERRIVQVLNNLVNNKARLVLLYLVLSGRDGDGFMREAPGLTELNVIFISGYGREETIVRARSRPARPTTS